MGDSWRCNSAQYHRTCGVVQLSSWRSEGWCVMCFEWSCYGT